MFARDVCFFPRPSPDSPLTCRPARTACLLTFGHWKHELWNGYEFQNISMFFYRCTHSPDEQRAAYEESCRRTGLRWHDEGPLWLDDPTSICCAPSDGYPNSLHRAILERENHDTLQRLIRIFGDPWEVPHDAWTGHKHKLRIAALCLFFIGLSLPDFRVEGLRKITAQELRHRIEDRSLRFRDAILNGWSSPMSYVFAPWAAKDTHYLQREAAFDTAWTPPCPTEGIYFMDRKRAHRWGGAVRGLNVVSRAGIPTLSGRFDEWFEQTNETFKQIAPKRRAILAGDKLYSATVEDAVAFKLAADTG